MKRYDDEVSRAVDRIRAAVASLLSSGGSIEEAEAAYEAGVREGQEYVDMRTRNAALLEKYGTRHAA